MGTCVSVESRWTDDHKQILTYITLTNTEPLKGNAKGNVTFVQLGGRVSDDVMHVVGAPTFEVGEEVLVFLASTSGSKSLANEANLWLLGLGQGKWRISDDFQTGAKIATMNTGAAHVMGKTTQGAVTRLLLSDLIERIKSAVKQEEGQ
jgi:hypothetical protein